MVKFTSLLAAGFIVVAGHAAPTGAAEQRCTELGSNCLCSEPLDTTSYVQVGDVFYDPADSSTKECAGEYNNGAAVTTPFNTMASDFTVVTETGMPAGNSVSMVMSQHGTNVHVNSGPVSSSIRRLCGRVYQRFTSDYEGKGEGQCTNNKSIQPVWYNNGEQYMEQGGGASVFHITIAGFSELAGFNLTGTGDQLDHHDCVSQWCRFELCVSGNILAGTNISFDGEVVGLNDGRKQTFPTTFAGTAAGNTSFWLPYYGYRAGTCAGKRFVSHVMAAQWTTAAGQRIGPAYEIEGGAGGVPAPPPPPSSPPPPPVLLP